MGVVSAGVAGVVGLWIRRLMLCDVPCALCAWVGCVGEGGDWSGSRVVSH